MIFLIIYIFCYYNRLYLLFSAAKLIRIIGREHLKFVKKTAKFVKNKKRLVIIADASLFLYFIRINH